MLRNQYKWARLEAGPDGIYLAPPGWEVHTVLKMNYVGGGKRDEMVCILHQVTTDKAATKAYRHGGKPI